MPDWEFTAKEAGGNLIHGPERKTAMNSRKGISSKPIDKVSEKELPDRLAELERQMVALRKEVDFLKKKFGGWPFPVDEEGYTEKEKPGPKEKIDDTDLFHNRLALILWLEPMWPWLEDRLSGTAEELRAVLEAVAENAEIKSDYQRRLLQNTDSLREFLSHERSGKTLAKATVIDALTLPLDDERRWRAANQLLTRRIANAMAGVPDITWRTSLDRCSAQPSDATVAINLDMHLRKGFGIPEPKDRDLTQLSCPVPKPLRRFLTQADAGLETEMPIDLTKGSAAGENEDI